MPLYFFDIHNGYGLYDKDYHGTDLPDAETARLDASKVACEFSEGWRHEPPGSLDSMVVEVVDENGRPVLTVPFPRTQETLQSSP
jgi:hypothetical protein